MKENSHSRYEIVDIEQIDNAAYVKNTEGVRIELTETYTGKPPAGLKPVTTTRPHPLPA